MSARIQQRANTAPTSRVELAGQAVDRALNDGIREAEDAHDGKRDPLHRDERQRDNASQEDEEPGHDPESERQAIAPLDNEHCSATPHT